MDVPELMPIEDYDAGKAKQLAAIKWLVYKAFDAKVPDDWSEPFYEDDQGEMCLKPAILHGLATSQLYCKACSTLFHNSVTKPTGHTDLLQFLARQGFYAVDTSESAITDKILAQRAPFRLKCHLAVIDTLMQAYSQHLLAVERVVKAVRSFAHVEASSELPSGVDDTLMFWLNKVCGSVRQQLTKYNQQVLQVHGRDSFAARDPSTIPVIEDLLRDICDGCCFAILLHFYCPQAVHFADIELNADGLSIADSMYNLQIVLEFCQVHLPAGVCTLTLNDLFYSNEELRCMLVVMLAEIFCWFEIKRLAIVRDITRPLFAAPEPKTLGTVDGEGDDGDVDSSSHAIIKPRISNATKKSFQIANDDNAVRNSSTPVSPQKNPLLPRRQQQTRGSVNNSDNTYSGYGKLTPFVRYLPSATGGSGDVQRQSIRAWEERHSPEKNNLAQSGVSGSQLTGVTDLSHSGSALLANVSMDTDQSADFISDTSIDLSDFETPRSSNLHSNPNTPRHNSPGQSNGQNPGHNPGNPGHNLGHSPRNAGNTPERRGVTAASSNHYPAEPLMPAHMRPSKEKTNNHTKEVERGDNPGKRSPSKPPPLHLTGGNGTTAYNGDSSGSSTPSEEYKTPSLESVSYPWDKEPLQPAPVKPPTSTPVSRPVTKPATRPVQKPKADKKYEAFYINQDPANNSTPRQVNIALERNAPASSSFSLHDGIRTPDQARAAGIPIVDPLPWSHLQDRSQDNSSSESSDQELKKIHADHKAKEHKLAASRVRPTPADAQRGRPTPADAQEMQRPDSLDIRKPIILNERGVAPVEKDSPKTSFAAIKKQRENGDVSPMMYVNIGTKGGNAGNSSLRDQYQCNRTGSRPEKKTTFAALPNQTTWQESAQRSNSQNMISNKENESAPAVQGTELHSIRMKLEEKRRQIETGKKRMEHQWNKRRQHVGKQAFMQVVAKGGKSDEGGPEGGRRTSMEPVIEESPSPLKATETIAATITAAREPETITAVPTGQLPRSREPSRERSREPSQERIRSATPPQFDSKSHLRDASPKPTHSHHDSSSAESELMITSDISSEVERVTRPKHNRPFEPSSSDLSSDSSMNAKVTRPSSTPALDRHHRSESPMTRSDPEYSDSQRTFSRQGIQDKIEGVRERWFGDKQDRDRKTRSASYDTLDNSSQPQQAINVNNKGKQQYGTSLDRLNCSLSELQGEIMRLSLQQDHIESIVKGDPDAPAPPAEVKPAAPAVTKQEQFYPRESEVSSTMAAVPPPPGPQQSYPSHMPYQAYPAAPTYPPGAHYPAPAPPPAPYMPGHPHTAAYPITHYPGMPAHYQTNPGMYAPPHVYPYQNMAGQPPTWTSPPQDSYLGGHTNMPPASHPMSTNYPNGSHMTNTMTTSVHSTLPRTPEPLDYNRSITPTTPGAAPSSPFSTGYTSQRSLSPPVSVTSPEKQRYVTPPSESPVEELREGEPTSPIGKSGFYVSFGGSSPKKQKPKLYSEQKHQPELSPPPVSPPVQPVYSTYDTPVQNTSPPYRSPPYTSPTKPLPQPSRRYSSEESTSGPSSPPQHAFTAISTPQSTTPHNVTMTMETPESSYSPPVSTSPDTFIVGETTDTMASIEQRELEKKRQKFVQMQMKRQKESEKKRLKIEEDRARQREEKRMQEEQEAQKKHEEKTKREAIYQQYLERKSERENAEEDSRAGISTVQKRVKKVQKKDRPKSQPVLPLSMTGGTGVLIGGGRPGMGGFNSGGGQMDDKLSQSSHSSQEELRGGGHGHLINLPPGMDAPDSAFHLSYGGLTHRRPPSPDKTARVQRQNSAESSSSKEASGGPNLKLFVKPSHKSNRHIMVNAISHCCLAGTVNTEPKNKVLQEMERSDEKHFVILFRDAGQQYRGVYTYNEETQTILKLHGVGPKALTDSMMERFFKYNSGTKSFSEITTTKHMTTTIDAVTIPNSMWQKKPTGGRKPPPGHV